MTNSFYICHAIAPNLEHDTHEVIAISNNQLVENNRYKSREEAELHCIKLDHEGYVRMSENKDKGRGR